MDKKMKRRLQAVLASYGADPSRWPKADRDALRHVRGRAGDDVAGAAAIDRILDLASAPPIPAGLESRLMSRLSDDRSTVVPFHSKPARSWPWAAVPLAASLALGIYLGAAGELDGFLPQAVTGDVATGDDDPSGVDAATDYSGDVLS